MLAKPESCRGCPWAQNMVGFVPDEQHNSEVFVLMQNPGATEVDFGAPAQGQAGKDMDYNFIPLAGLTRGSTVTVGNVLKCRWNNSNDLTWDKVQAGAVACCTLNHLRIPPTTKLIIAQGKLAFDYLNHGLRGEDYKPASITNWRGFLLPYPIWMTNEGQIYFGDQLETNTTTNEGTWIPLSALQLNDWICKGKTRNARISGDLSGNTFIATAVAVYSCLHTADLYHTPQMEVVTRWDWTKVRCILDGDYPKPLPPRLIVTKENLPDVRRWFMKARQSRWVTVDTEYIPGTGYLTILGLLSRSHDGRVEGCQLDVRSTDPRTVREIYYHYRELIQYVPIIFHNCRADVPVLRKAIGTGVDWENYKSIEDTMLGHAIIWCELPHTLEFIASVHGQYPKLKHLKANDELLYNFGDCLETDSIWYYLAEEGFKHDRPAESIYRDQLLKLCPILDRSISRGLRVDDTRVRAAQLEYEALVIAAERLASAGAGWPININSNKQVSGYLYGVRGLELQSKRDTGNSSIDDEAVARLRMALGPPFDPEDALTYPIALQRIEQGADPILEARVLYATANTCLTKYIYALYENVAKIKKYDYATKGAYDKARDQAIRKVKQGTGGAILGRIHPDMLTHSQKTGRWSTVDPPIAQLPKGLRDIVIPDPGEVWITWDWSAIEPRILEGYCNSKILRAAFDEGIDLHTWTVCSVFGYDYPVNLIDPHRSPECAEWRAKYKWKGKDDPRRVFAKSARYEMYYGGTGSNAAKAAALFGLDPKVLRRACASLVSSDPEYYQWRLELEETIKRTRVLRTFMGRPRRFLKGGHKMVRDGLDQPMQGGTSDIANVTVVTLAESNIPSLQFAWSMHDSQKWHLKRDQCTPEFMRWVRQIAARPHVINGRAIPFPIDLEIIYPPGEPVLKGLEEYTHVVT